MSDDPEKNEDDNLNNIFNIEPIENFIAPKDLSLLDDPENISRLAVKDIQTARENIIDMIEIGNDSVKMLAALSIASQRPDAFKSLAELMRTVISANKILLDIHKDNKDITGVSAEPEQKVVNNNLFVGSTAEFSALMKKLDKDSGQ